MAKVKSLEKSSATASDKHKYALSFSLKFWNPKKNSEIWDFFNTIPTNRRYERQTLEHHVKEKIVSLVLDAKAKASPQLERPGLSKKGKKSILKNVSSEIASGQTGDNRLKKKLSYLIRSAYHYVYKNNAGEGCLVSTEERAASLLKAEQKRKRKNLLKKPRTVKRSGEGRRQFSQKNLHRSCAFGH